VLRASTNALSRAPHFAPASDAPADGDSDAAAAAAAAEPSTSGSGGGGGGGGAGGGGGGAGSMLFELELGGNALVDAAGLGSLPALRTLNLAESERLADVSALAGLGALAVLKLGGCPLLEAWAPLRAALAGLPGLRALELAGCPVLDAEPDCRAKVRFAARSSAACEPDWPPTGLAANRIGRQPDWPPTGLAANRARSVSRGTRLLSRDQQRASTAALRHAPTPASRMSRLVPTLTRALPPPPRDWPFSADS
jgi:hypothetical protein